MKAQQNKEPDHLTNLDAVAYLLFAASMISIVIGIGSRITGSAHIETSAFLFAAEWNHTAMIIFGVIGMAISAGLETASKRLKK